MNTTMRSIFGPFLIVFCILRTVLAQQVPTNVTVAPMLATFIGSWTCSVAGEQAVDNGACPTGCRAASIGDTMRIAFEGSAAWLTVQQGVASSVVLSIQLDEAQTYYAARRDNGAAGCYGDVLVGSNLDPTKLHVVTISVIEAGAGEAFVFGGLTVVIDQSSTVSLSPSADDNVSGQASLGQPPERTAVIIGVLGGVTAFWILAGLAICHVRRVQRTTSKHPFHTVEVISVDKAQTRTVAVGVGADSQATMVNRAIGVDSAVTMVEARDANKVLQRSLVGTTRTMSSVSSYPATVDVPLPPSFPTPVPSVPSLPANRRDDSIAWSPRNHPSRTLVASSPDTTKWEREIQWMAKEEGNTKGVESMRRMQGSVSSPDEPREAMSEVGFMSAGGLSTSSIAPPLYESSSTQYANGLQRRWM